MGSPAPRGQGQGQEQGQGRRRAGSYYNIIHHIIIIILNSCSIDSNSYYNDY